MERPSYVPSNGVAYREIEGRVYIVDPWSTKLISLNEVGSRVWMALSSSPFDEIVDDVVGEFDVDRPTAERDVRAFLQDMLDRGLLRESH